jgi:hypothetical protein
MTGRPAPFLAAAVIACLPAGSAAASTNQAIEEVVEVEVVQVVQAVDSAAGSAPREIGAVQVYGRMHPALVHLPIGFLFLVALLEIATLTRRGQALAGCTGLALAAALAVAGVGGHLGGRLVFGESFLPF